MKKNIRAIIKSMTAGATAILLCALAVMPSFAAIDPAGPYAGSVAGGLFVADGATALALERTEIELNACELPPESRYKTEEEFIAYSANTIATYTIHNPTDQTVTERMLTPIGTDPWYAYDLPYGTDANKYTVEIDGEQVQAQQRHSYTPDNSYYHAPTQLGKRDPASAFLAYYSDTYVSHPLLAPDATVYVYAYRTEYDTSQKDDMFEVSGSLVADPSRCAVLVTDAWYPASAWYPANAGENKVRISFPGFNRENPTVYSIGADVGEVAWTVDADGDRLDARVTLVSKTTMSFYELIMKGYDAQGSVSEIDYYNAVVAYITSNRTEGTAVTYMGDTVELNESNLQAWNSFDLTLAPGQSATVKVTAPLHPFEHGNYSPSVYTYAFAMTAAEAWSTCGPTSVRILTDLYLCDVDAPTPSQKEYEQTEDGYCWEGDTDFDYLVISVCEKQKPFDSSMIALLLYLLVILIVLFVCVILPAAVPLAILALIILLIVRKVRKKRRAAEQIPPQPEKITETEGEEKEKNDDA